MRAPTYNFVFAGTASPDIAKRLAGKLRLPLGKTELTRFVNSEFRLRIRENVAGKNCIIVASTGAPVHENIMELFLLVDTLRKGGAKEILAVIPYFGYSRQHARFRDGESVSSDVILRTLRLLGAKTVITCDFHNAKHLETAPLHVRNISALPFLANEFRRIVKADGAVVVSPDEGGITRGKLFASHFFGKKKTQFTFFRKKRDLHRAHRITHTTCENEKLLKGQSVIVVDDICTSGNTLLSAVTLCLKKGAKDVYAAITHPDMDKAVIRRVMRSPIKRIVTTNSIGQKDNIKQSKKIKTVDITDVLDSSLF